MESKFDHLEAVPFSEGYGEITYFFRDKRTKKVAPVYTLWDIYCLKTHEMQDYDRQVRVQHRGRPQLVIREGHCVVQDNTPPQPIQTKGQLASWIGHEYFEYYNEKGTTPREVRNIMENTILVAVHRCQAYYGNGWRAELIPREDDPIAALDSSERSILPDLSGLSLEDD
ncbi:hypothetical protein BD310DRAFT_980583 [Dichomitus squalens]|uniref:Uncharacterized protein n=1 Tax=Dichomitus squalens TaxID=114155 RepID=A0A4V2K6Z9_9APHY|nr:hypothetical protein BD310DRAFT_980583 [Dichomitus squalens]